jgi:uncharacterized protein (DUF1501 family)
MKIPRRAFLHQSVCAALGVPAITSAIGDFIRVTAAVPDVKDYKALVCVFLYGGNDGDNCLIPYSQSEYKTYAAQRGALAIPHAQLLPIKPRTSDGRDYGLHPDWPELQALFKQGKLALLANVGPLIEPTTRAMYTAKRAKLPRNLFSHSDQQAIWSNSRPDDLATGTGWGGRVADLMNSINTNAHISMSVSVSGANVFQVGNTVVPYQLSPHSGSIGLTNIKLDAKPDPVSRAFLELLEQKHPGLFESEYSHVVKRAIEADQIVKATLAKATLKTPFPAGNLGTQMKMIARLIAARKSLGLQRQIFFCSLGSFDTHGDQLTEHPPLLREVSQSLQAFYKTTVELGVASQVTTFTMSDFGRTFRSNGKGSDHGWGSHHLILGDAVNGGELYGHFPTQVINGPDDTELGRWIPTTACDQYAATLALWFGVSKSELPTVLPNIGRFATEKLGFMMSS